MNQFNNQLHYELFCDLITVAECENYYTICSISVEESKVDAGKWETIETHYFLHENYCNKVKYK